MAAKTASEKRNTVANRATRSKVRQRRVRRPDRSLGQVVAQHLRATITSPDVEILFQL